MPAVTAKSGQGPRAGTATSDNAWWVLAAAGAAAVFALAFLAVHLAPPGSDLAAWWPAAGASVLVLAVSPARRRWYWIPIVLLTSGVANYVGGRPTDVAIGYGLANAAEALVAATLLNRRSRGRASLRTLVDLVHLTVLAVSAAAAAGVVAAATAGLLLAASPLDVVPTVTAAHGAAILLIAPLAMRLPEPVGEAKPLEIGAQWLALILCVAIVFGPGQRLPLAFAPLPLLVWAALRRPFRVMLAQLLVVGVMVSLLTGANGGPFAPVGSELGVLASPLHVTALVQAYLLVIALVGLPLAMVSSQRRQALRQALAGEEMLRQSVQRSLVGQILLRRDDAGIHPIDANPMGRALLGLAAADRDLGSALEKHDLARVVDAAGRLLSGEQATWSDELVLPRSGRIIRLGLTALHPDSFPDTLSAQLVDLTTERRAQRALKRERDFSVGILGTARCLIVVVDGSNQVVEFGAEAQAVTGRAEAAVLGRPLADLMTPEHGGAANLAVQMVRQGLETHRVDLLCTTVRGEPRLISWALSSLDTSQGRHVVMTGIDVTDERAARDLLESVLSGARGTSIIATDSHGVITLFNTGAELMLGYRADEVVGVATPALFHDPDEMAHRAALLGVEPGIPVFTALLTDGGSSVRRDWTYVCADGRRLTVALTVTVTRDASGGVTGYVGLAEDVTERREAESSLRRTLEKEREAVMRLNELDRVKTDFVSAVSHELRTPITSVLGYAAMLGDRSNGPLDTHQRMLLDRVETNGRRLLALIEDLLTLSAIESGSFTSRRERVDLRDVVSDALDGVEGMRAQRKLSLEVLVPDTPVTVLGDEDQLSRAVINLLSNAIKFTPDGGHVSVHLSTDPDRCAVVEVADTGIGIPEEEQGELFGRFFRASTARQQSIGGTGLGLSIVRTIVSSHGGVMRVDSSSGKGSRFQMQLPLANSACEEDPDGHRPPATSATVTSSSSGVNGLTR